MSQSNSASPNQSTEAQFSTAHFQIECCDIDRDTIGEIETLAAEAGIRTENFEFAHSEDSITGSPTLRVKGLEHESAEQLIKTLAEDGLMETVDDNLLITILPTGS